MDPAMSEEVYTVEQFAERLRLHPKTVRRFIREGRLRAVKVGRSYRILRSDMEAFGIPRSNAAPVRVTVDPDTVHGPAAVNVTVRPDDAVAETGNGASLNVLSGSGPNVIVWFAFAMSNDRVTSAAAL